MLTKRLLTSLVLIPFGLFLVLFTNFLWFAGLMSVLLAIAANEWSHLTPLNKPWQHLCYVLFVLVMAICSLTLTPRVIFNFSIVWWVIAFFWIKNFPEKTQFWNKSIVLLFLGTQVLIPLWYLFIKLKFFGGEEWILLLIIIVCAADTGAYFAGRLFGKHLLAAHVSPKKTWEGFFGGVLLSILAVVLYLQYVTFTQHHFVQWISLTALVFLFSVLGDLLESMLKRLHGVKDSGNWLPGHGGLLDRIDSLTAATPVFGLGLMMLEKVTLS